VHDQSIKIGESSQISSAPSISLWPLSIAVLLFMIPAHRRNALLPGRTNADGEAALAGEVLCLGRLHACLSGRASLGVTASWLSVICSHPRTPRHNSPHTCLLHLQLHV